MFCGKDGRRGQSHVISLTASWRLRMRELKLTVLHMRGSRLPGSFVRDPVIHTRSVISGAFPSHFFCARDWNSFLPVRRPMTKWCLRIGCARSSASGAGRNRTRRQMCSRIASKANTTAEMSYTECVTRVEGRVVWEVGGGVAGQIHIGGATARGRRQTSDLRPPPRIWSIYVVQILLVQRIFYSSNPYRLSRMICVAIFRIKAFLWLILCDSNATSYRPWTIMIIFIGIPFTRCHLGLYYKRLWRSQCHVNKSTNNITKAIANKLVRIK